ncbi:hypothetical protein OV320_2579 [Actinobacteria bacterium OV320]|jgi:hypothetical protein|nr:hypothetical protein OV320_2579 [Actinobacteria bacterium OV320]
MTEPFEMPPAKTMDDINKVADFIKARVEPLRASAKYDSDQRRAHQALLDMVSVAQGSAWAETARGDDPRMEYFFLATAAREWRGHPDFLPEWKN